MTDAKRQLVKLLRSEALTLGEFVLSSGRTSHYYVDVRRATLLSNGAALIGGQVLRVVGSLLDLPIHAVGGTTLGADPIVGATLALAGARGWNGLKGFLVRKEAKRHGTGRLVEGPLAPNETVLIVDDVATTGASALHAVDVVEAMDCEVAGVVVVLDRLEGAAEAFAARGLPFHALTTIRDLGIEPIQDSLDGGAVGAGRSEPV